MMPLASDHPLPAPTSAAGNAVLENTSPYRRVKRALLGFFILWQLIYLIGANGLETLQVVTRRFPETHQWIIDVVDESRSGKISSTAPPLSPLIYVFDKWGQLVEQPQRWSLFAPNVGKQTGFLALELKWEGVEDSVWWYSDDEPEDTASYLRAGGNRFRSVEQNLAMTFSQSIEETDDDARQRWGHQIQQKLSTDSDALMAWVSIRVLDFQRAHPQAPAPDEIIIHSRGYEIPAPNETQRWDRNTPYCIAIARWCPSASVVDGILPIEAYDPVQNQFVYQPYATENVQ